MVLAEIPLWVSHGNPSSADSNGTRTLPGMGGGLEATKSNTSSTSQQSIDQAAAKSVLALLSSTRSGSSGRAPMYSIDVHPDGTRFATAAGDGAVKIWSTSCLFGGKLSSIDEGTKNKKMMTKNKKKRGPTSKFTDNGNYVSSQSEDYESSTSSSEEREGHHDASQQKQQPPATPQAGVNDLSGLVRKKKGGTSLSAASPQKKKENPFTSSDANSNNNLGTSSLSPLSRLTQRPAAGGNNNPTSLSANNNSNTTINTTTNKRHKLLSTISSHEGSVLSLRFSPSGTYLATAGDDSYVNIYIRSSTPSLAKGNLVGVGADGPKSTGIGGGGSNANGCDSQEDIEHWNRIAICRGHHLDVVGLTWAPDDSHLVSCSLDSSNPIIVWRLFDVLGCGEEYNNNQGGVAAMGGGGGGGGTLGLSGTNTSVSVHVHNINPFKILGRDVHTSTVKGVAFDPAGKYLATSGDDPAICIWRAFDDWGLEARVDSTSGVFRSKKRKRATAAATGGANSPRGSTAATVMDEMEEDDPGELASLSLFRRISFAPDGSHVCGTNATLRGKNIAAMISREGWAASGPPRDGKGDNNNDADGSSKKPPPGAANLVGHKQPVVASRHCPIFFTVPKKKSGESSSSEEEEESDDSDDDDPDVEPEYSTLVALGDKRGFVTIWSTKSTRPIFKMQCSESRCTVTDISWGVVRRPSQKIGIDEEQAGGDSLVMIVSLLDGYIVALHFSIPNEVGGGSILSSEKTRRVFRLKYGIEDFVENYCFSPGKKQRKSKKRLVDDAGPMLIENALQLTMEMEAEANDGEEDESDDVDSGKEGCSTTKQAPAGSQDGASAVGAATSGNIKEKQKETSTKGGKKRIRPVLMAVGGGTVSNVSDEDNAKEASGKKRQKKSKDKPSDALQNALSAASQAASAAEGVATQASSRSVSGSGDQTAHTSTQARPSNTLRAAVNDMGSRVSLGAAVNIPYSTSKVLSVDLTTKTSTSSSANILDERVDNIIADCTNSTSGGAPSFTLSVSRGGTKKWKDIVVRSKATALTANHQLLAVGTSDGCLYLYGTSPTLGWTSCKAYRAFPPFVLGSPLVEISINSASLNGDNTYASYEMVVVTSDGNFYVYKFSSGVPKLSYKGSIIPAMQHMNLSFNQQCLTSSTQPKMARIQITDSNQLMLILVLPIKSSGGRSLQGFVYNRDMELWMRICDSNNFVLSDFYSSLPGQNNNGAVQGESLDNVGILSKMDGIVKSSASAIASAKQMYQKVAASSENINATQKIVTRSHCEDRLACSIALGSNSEFGIWLRYYARCLSSTGDGDALRFLVDILLDDHQCSSSMDTTEEGNSIESFLSVGKSVLGLDGKNLVGKYVLPEMSKNRLLQRLTNEISMELAC